MIPEQTGQEYSNALTDENVLRYIEAVREGHELRSREVFLELFGEDDCKTGEESEVRSEAIAKFADMCREAVEAGEKPVEETKPEDTVDATESTEANQPSKASD